MPNVYVKDAGAWKAAKEIFVKDVGTWKTVKQVWVKEAGIWQQAYPEAVTPSVYSSAGTFSVVVPNGIYSVLARGVGGGGAGSQGGYDNGDNGIAGRPGSSFSGTYAVVPGSTLTVTVGAGGICTGPGNSGSPSSLVGELNGSTQTLTAAGGTGAGTSNSPGGGSGAWYLTAGWVQTTDSNEANSAYTSWYGTRTGGFSIAGAGGAGTAGVYGGAGGGGGGPNGGFSIALGGNGGTGVIILEWS